VWMGLWRAGMSVAGIDGGALYALGVAILIGGALIIAWIMWRVVEEPAREWMRGLVGTRRTPTEEAGEEIVDQEPKQERSDEPIDPVVVPDDDQR
jgi:peptidoglycan/LPS O-acetylase OafA/YrhL